MDGRTREELRWRLFRTFFRSRARFLTLFARYEERVLAFSERYRSHRSRLRLPVDELLTLLDLKGLEELRDHEILELKAVAHELFRGPDRTDPFDHLVSNIYHEISILKEEHYTLREDYLRRDPREYERFFREVSQFYPKRLRHVRRLYARALKRLLELAPSFTGERILIRSLHLFGEALLAEHFPRGLIGLYRRMYPRFGEVDAYAAIGRSFDESGFEEESAGAWRKALKALEGRRFADANGELAAIREECERRLADLSQRIPAGPTV